MPRRPLEGIWAVVLILLYTKKAPSEDRALRIDSITYWQMTCEIHSFGLGGISLIQRSIASGGYACDREQPTSGNGRTILFYLTTQRGHTQVSLRIWCRLDTDTLVLLIINMLVNKSSSLSVANV